MKVTGYVILEPAQTTREAVEPLVAAVVNAREAVIPYAPQGSKVEVTIADGKVSVVIED